MASKGIGDRSLPGKGIVAAGHELTAQAAETVLREGGNAFDAILAAHFAAMVAEPVLASLGGGGFMTAKPCDGEPVVYDFFVQTPRHKRPVDELNFRPIVANFGATQQEFHIGQGTIATPGSVKGIFAIHRELGSMPLAQIAAPAVQYARDGVTLNATQAYVFRIVRSIYTATPEAREIFGAAVSPGLDLQENEDAGDDTASEEIPSSKARGDSNEGQVVRLTQLAETIERIAAEGEDLFYQGDIAREIATHCQDHGGHLTRRDLEDYQVVKRKPLDIHYRGAHVMTNPPPSSAGILIAFALELFKATDLSRAEFGRYSHLRLLAEVITLTHKARVDALAASDGPADRANDLLDPRFLKRYREEVMNRAQSIRGTTHMSVIDAHENVASMSVSNGEGCGSIVPGTGMMLNNMLGEQDLNIDGFHLWEEDQRMTSMMAPTLIRMPNGTLVATGSGGSNRIRTALLQVIMNLTHFEMDVKTAVASPRIHMEATKLSVEGGFDSREVDRLIAHYPEHERWTDKNLFFGGTHTVMTGDGEYAGAGDPRRGGVCRIVE